MNLYSILKLAHVLAAFWFIAGIIGRQLIRAHARSSQDIHDFAELSRMAGRFESLMVIPGNLAVILVGIPLALVGGWPILGFLQGGSSNWLLVTNLILVLGFFTVPLIFIPRGKIFDRVLQSALAAGQITPELRASLDDPVVKYTHWAENAGLLIIIVLMVLKPF
jgi:uncharacterized membrane protein